MSERRWTEATTLTNLAGLGGLVADRPSCNNIGVGIAEVGIERFHREHSRTSQEVVTEHLLGWRRGGQWTCLVVLTHDEVDLLLSEMDGAPLLVCSLLNGLGPQLRMKQH